MFGSKSGIRNLKKGLEDARAGASMIRGASSGSSKRALREAEKRRDMHKQQALAHRKRAHGWGAKKEERLANRSEALAEEAQQEIDRLSRKAPASKTPTADASEALVELEDEFSRGKLDKKTFDRRSAALQRQIDRASA